MTINRIEAITVAVILVVATLSTWSICSINSGSGYQNPVSGIVVAFVLSMMLAVGFIGLPVSLVYGKK